MKKAEYLLAIFAGFMLGGIFFSIFNQADVKTVNASTSQRNYGVQKVVRANQFELIGGDGKVIAGLRYVANNTPIFFMSDTSGNELVDISLRRYGPEIKLKDRNNSLRIEANIIAGNPSLILFDKNQNKSIELRYLEDLPIFCLNNKEGNTQIGMDYSPDGSPRIYLASKEGRAYPKVELSYDNQNKCAKLNLANNKNAQAFVASVCDNDIITVQANGEDISKITKFTMKKGKPKMEYQSGTNLRTIWKGQ